MFSHNTPLLILNPAAASLARLLDYGRAACFHHPATTYSKNHTVLKESIKYSTQSTLCIKNVELLDANITGDAPLQVCQESISMCQRNGLISLRKFTARSLDLMNECDGMYISCLMTLLFFQLYQHANVQRLMHPSVCAPVSLYFLAQFLQPIKEDVSQVHEPSCCGGAPAELAACNIQNTERKFNYLEKSVCVKGCQPGLSLRERLQSMIIWPSAAFVIAQNNTTCGSTACCQ